MTFDNEQDPLYDYWSNIVDKLEQIKPEDNPDEIQNIKDNILESIEKLVDGYSKKIQTIAPKIAEIEVGGYTITPYKPIPGGSENNIFLQNEIGEGTSVDLDWLWKNTF